MSLYDEYADVVARYRPLYDKVLVMIEVGSFLEWYNCDQNRGADVKGVCELLNVQATRRNKSQPLASRQNPELGGIPRHALPKYLPTLLGAGYTVVLVTQTTPPPNPRREVTEVISRATGVDALGTAAAIPGPMLSLFLELAPNRAECLLGFGVATLSAFTGESGAYECWSQSAPTSTLHDAGADAWLWDEIRRCILQAEPSEVVLLSAPAQPAARELLARRVRTMARCPVHDWAGSRPEHCARVARASCQEEVLRRVFPDTGLLTAVEHCGLERQPLALAAFSAVLDFAAQHNEGLVQRISPPGLREPTSRLTLAHGSATQLDIVSAERPRECLAGLLNRAVTAHGRRAFAQSLLDPVTDARELRRRYDNIDRVLGTQQAGAERLRRMLVRCYDVPRLHRRMATGRAQPREVGMLWDSLAAGVELCAALPEGFALPAPAQGQARGVAEVQDKVARALRAMEALFEPDELARCASSAQEAAANLFVRGAYPVIDAHFDSAAAARRVVDSVADALNGMHASLASSESSRVFRTESVGSDGAGDYCVITTVKRFAAAREAARKWPASARILKAPDGAWSVDHDEITSAAAVGWGAGYVRLHHPVLDGASAQSQMARRAASAELARAFSESCTRVACDHADALLDLGELTSWTDVACACALNARELRHRRPLLLPMPDVAEASTRSSFRAKGLRHPIIEALNDRVPHVPNDVSLGGSGMLVYGMNAAGKSSLMKAIGIAVVMAQAGMFVAADALELAPYNAVMTRIGGGDNIFAGQSTFMAEMQELRAILRRADGRTLVLGDEICAGTESVSATAIVGAALQQLAESGASYVFATHLHELGALDAVTGIKGLSVWHLAVSTDAATGALVYDRRLTPGRGSDLYGLEVCQYLGMSACFMRHATTIRRQLLGLPGQSALSLERRSRYSARLVVDACGVCGRPATDVHHIQHQASADDDGFIGSEHKNRRSNLVPLCQACHDETHHGGLDIRGYAQTSSGVRLLTSAVADRDRAHAPLKGAPCPAPVVADIISMRGNGMTYKKIAQQVFSRYGIEYSLHTLRRLAVAAACNSDNSPQPEPEDDPPRPNPFAAFALRPEA